jgi:SAM-dependent methyltransferase
MAPETMFADRDVLDVGSGYGGTAARFLKYGARSVTGLEVTNEKVRESASFARARGVDDHVRFVLGIGEAIPCGDEQFDLITMYDVLEHVVSPRQVVAECFRVLRPGGVFATVFPPYYDTQAGSHLHGYATRLPGLNLLFTTRMLRSAAERLLQEQRVDYEAFFRNVPSDRLWNQNGLTVRGFKRIVEASPFEVQLQRYIGHHDRRISRSRWASSAVAAPLFATFELAAGAPILREALCARVCALLRRR